MKQVQKQKICLQKYAFENTQIHAQNYTNLSSISVNGLMSGRLRTIMSLTLTNKFFTMIISSPFSARHKRKISFHVFDTFLGFFSAVNSLFCVVTIFWTAIWNDIEHSGKCILSKKPLCELTHGSTDLGSNASGLLMQKTFITTFRTCVSLEIFL